MVRAKEAFVFPLETPNNVLGRKPSSRKYSQIVCSVLDSKAANRHRDSALIAENKQVR
jgi:hypothetical protein